MHIYIALIASTLRTVHIVAIIRITRILRFGEAIEDLLSKGAHTLADITRLRHLLAHVLPLLIPQPASHVCAACAFTNIQLHIRNVHEKCTLAPTKIITERSRPKEAHL